MYSGSFIIMERNTLAKLSASEPVPDEGVRVLSRLEENAVQYTAGCVIKKADNKIFFKGSKCCHNC